MNEVIFIAELWDYAQKFNRPATIKEFKPKIKELVIAKIKDQFTITSDTAVLTGKPQEIMQRILEDVCRVLEADPKKMLNHRRHVEVSYMRHLFVKLCVDHKVATRKAIGQFMNRDHTTVIHSFRQADGLIQTKETTFMAMWTRYLVNGDKLFTGIYDKSLLQLNKI